jgi:hypothetical protein
MLHSILIYYFHYPRIRSLSHRENGATTTTNCNNSARPARLPCSEDLTKIKLDIIRENIASADNEPATVMTRGEVSMRTRFDGSAFNVTAELSN